MTSMTLQQKYNLAQVERAKREAKVEIAGLTTTKQQVLREDITQEIHNVKGQLASIALRARNVYVSGGDDPDAKFAARPGFEQPFKNIQLEWNRKWGELKALQAKLEVLS